MLLPSHSEVQMVTQSRLHRTLGYPNATYGSLLLTLGGQKQKTITVQKPHIQTFPVELRLEIFSHLELKPYVISHGVCKAWKQELPHAILHPIRRRMLDSCRTLRDMPGVWENCQFYVEDLKPFDRDNYINTLLEQYPVIPEEFVFWIREWPERLALEYMWPGLPFRPCVQELFENAVNWFGYLPHSPQLSAIRYYYWTPAVKFVPVLLIYRNSDSTVWLILDKDEPDIFGKVIELSTTRGDAPTIIPHPEPEDLDDDSSWEDDGGPLMISHPDWITFQVAEWTTFAQTGLKHRKIKTFPTPANFSLNAPSALHLPAPRWIDRSLPSSLAILQK
ncbi:hypothetical protein CPC08DRAFT_705571 [Agrocybe pediades]|nr:hypothetical protein CPC08DRAFT_705571 [Agrocybe pediades]